MSREFYSYRVSVLNLAVLLTHLYRAQQHPEIGYLDADKTMKDYIDSLNISIRMPQPWLESMLWCANMIDESDQDAFWHPQGKSFKRFVQDLVPPDLAFDSFYNLIVNYKKAGGFKNENLIKGKCGNREIVEGPEKSPRKKYGAHPKN